MERKEDEMFLEKINGPSDVKKLSLVELNELSIEIRKVLIEKTSKHGGHVGPNLGIVELTIALHYVFDSPKDKIVYDVSHQTYPHKILTGRKEAFLKEEAYDTVTGFSNPHESEHDFFEIGHTSTSISLACGLMKARDLRGDRENIVAVIGDGSLSGGEAYEGLNNAVDTGTNMIVIVNDNEMSIAENHGGLYKNLRELRESNGTYPCNFFKAMGFEYHFVKDGHDLESLIHTLKEVKDTTQPVVVHVHTTKGKGYHFAEEDKETWHWNSPFIIETGESRNTFNPAENHEQMMYENVTDITSKYLYEKMQKDSKMVAITSATPTIFGFSREQRKALGKQFVDVGIAEEHAVALASGIAKNGGKPVYAVYSSFLQRTYDQLSQDLCINQNSATILVCAATVLESSDITHLGIFDIAMIGNIPRLVYLAPTCKEEYIAMLKWSIQQTEHPVAIRLSEYRLKVTGKEDTTDYSILNRYEITKKGSEVAIIALGSFYDIGEKTVCVLKEKLGIDATLINPKFITGIDKQMLENLKKDHQLVVTLEDGILEGGFGEKIASYYGPSEMKVKNYGIPKSFPHDYNPQELLKTYGITAEQITQTIKNIRNK